MSEHSHNLDSTTNFPSSRTINSTSRLSFYTDQPTTRRSSFQSAQQSLYQDADSSIVNHDVVDPEIDSDSEVPSQRVPSRIGHSTTASPFEHRPGSAASFTHAITPSLSRRSPEDDELETTTDAPNASTLGRRTSYTKRQSVDMSRPLSSLSRRSSTSGNNHTEENRLREAATAAANRSSMSNRRHSTEIDELVNSMSRSSTPRGFHTEGQDDDRDARPRSRSSSSMALRRYEEGEGSFIKQDATDKGGTRGSILPPAAFFAPKKPSARNSKSDLLGAANQQVRSASALSFHSNVPTAAAEDGQTSMPTTNYEQPARPTSPWGMAPHDNEILSSNQNATTYGVGRGGDAGGDGTRPLTPLDANDGFPTPSAQPSPHSVVRLMTSTDPLLPVKAIPNATVNADTGIGLGFDTKSPVANGNYASSKGRATLPESQSTHKTAVPSPATAAGAQSATTTTASPVANPAKRGARNYKSHKGSNRFLLDGLLMTSGDNPVPFILSYLLLLALGGLFFGFEAKWLSDNISPAVIAFFAYIWLLSVVNMGVTAFSDPGIIHRDLDPDPPCVLGDTPFIPGLQAVADPEDPLAIPVQRVLRIRGQVVKVKWCETCGTYRPPRSSHCRVCDNCVENIDHHCTYLNNCIGRRNYVSFMAFLLFSILSALYVIAFTALHLVLLTRPTSYRYPRDEGDGNAPGLTFRQALGRSPVSAVLFVLCIAAVGPLMLLFVYHVRLVLLNRSTVEQIRINTARDYGEQKELELGIHGAEEDDGDAGSTYGAAETNWRSRSRGKGVIRSVLERLRILKPKYKDPNPFATRSWSRNVGSALGWRSVELGSWIDPRGRSKQEQKLLPNLKPTSQKVGYKV
ncbi:related to ERF2 - subunit of a palmitoyltransferase [Melanopsichium pennsylvanicum]|uniref:Palmitoyltransferase n=2 Tax=Melanopsichium pennsylvanicum TaxID=63383 RepID=A0AAJ5C829_9BASI|nr:dhhc-type zn-finger partial [Melanopsichium pennsylvanicum 4]SNX87570.1 related to ERF2 - subunit of a palmitoyltransferase [Melanopsichium pennsylvanicum]